MFYCFVGGKGFLRIIWFCQNGKLLFSRVVVFGKVLLIRRVRKEDEGIYECIVRNVYGFDIVILQLIVKGQKCEIFFIFIYVKGRIFS